MAAVAGLGLGLLVLGWIAVVAVRQELTLAPGGPVAFLHGVDLVFHEAGHVIWGLLGRFMGVPGVSLTQVLIPLICAGAFLRTRRYASVAFAVFWAGSRCATWPSTPPTAGPWRFRCWPTAFSMTGTGSSARSASSTVRRRSGAPVRAGAALMLGALAFLARDLLPAWSEARGDSVDSSGSPRVE